VLGVARRKRGGWEVVEYGVVECRTENMCGLTTSPYAPLPHYPLPHTASFPVPTPQPHRLPPPPTHTALPPEPVAPLKISDYDQHTDVWNLCYQTFCRCIGVNG